MVLPTVDVASLRPLSDHLRGGQTAPAAVAEQPQAAEPVVAKSGAGGDNPVNLTDTARTEVTRLMATGDNEGQGLRLAVAGGGCSGLVYKVEFDTRREGDLVVPGRGFDAYLDRKSTIYLRGVVLDHQAGLGGRGFVFNNPNASNTCGCGESFAV